MTNFVKHVCFAKVGKVKESNRRSSDTLSSDHLSSDHLSSDPLSSDPLSGDIETILFRAGTKTIQKRRISTKTVQKLYISTKALQQRYKSGTKTEQKLYKSDVQNDKRGFHQRAPNKSDRGQANLRSNVRNGSDRCLKMLEYWTCLNT